jgi:preprotein translocase subunit SecE
VARNRQRAKQRQADRRARRLSERPDVEPQDDRAQRRAVERDAPPDVPDIEDPHAANPAPGIFPEVAVGAPPEDEGRADKVAVDEPVLDEDEALDEIEDAELGDGAGAEETYAPRGRRAAEAAPARDRPRFLQFLSAVWAELQRVQWPNRQALTTLTGVVLGFVLIAGGYLGLLDAIFSRIIQAIL